MQINNVILIIYYNTVAAALETGYCGAMFLLLCILHLIERTHNQNGNMIHFKKMQT